MSTSDEDLLAAARTDPDGFGVFYDRHVHAVLAFAVRRVGAEAGADICAEVFAAALVSAHRFDPRRGDAIAWLYGIARNQVLMFERSGAVELRARRRLGLARIDLSDEGIERVERLAGLDVPGLSAALDALPPAHRDAVVARVVGEQSYEAIGRDADVSPLLARQRVSRGLAGLRKRLGETR